MDKGTQKMKPLDSPQERAITIKTFINARLNKTTKITSYEPLVNYLNGNHLQSLYKNLPRSGPSREEIKMLLANNKLEKISAIYNETDAKMYLDWLISVVQGFSPDSANEELVNKAFDQLSTCILILTDVTEWKKDMMLSKPYEWVTKLEEFEADIAGMIKDEVKETAKELETYQYTISGYDKKLDAIIETLEEKVETLTEKANDLRDWRKTDAVT